MAKIVIYSADWCSYCTEAKNYLDNRDISYDERDINKDPSALAELLAINNGQVSIPVIKINDRIIHGFSPQAIDQELNNMVSK